MQMSIKSKIEENKNKTWVIMAFFPALIALICYFISKTLGYNSSFVGIVFLISVIGAGMSYYWSDRLVLSISGAKKADKKKETRLFSIVERVSHLARISSPKIYIIEDNSSNAFATGRSPTHASICVTRGLLEKMNDEELEGVIAHEMSHVQNYDIRLMAIVSVLVGFVVFFTDWFMRSLWWGGLSRDNDDNRNVQGIGLVVAIILSFLAPIMATLMQLSISRKREYLADASGVLLTKNPLGLASALQKLADEKTILKTATNATAHLYIVNPFKGKNAGMWFASLFNTHPPIEERIATLKGMVDEV